MNKTGSKYLKWIISIGIHGALLIGSCYAQNASLNDFISSERVSLPSPQATSLLKVQATPVNYYTGALKISIPIYELKSGDLSIPIALNYSGSGIKVSERAGEIGLGWSLQAGGMVTRVMKGKPDEKAHGYIEEANYLNDNWGNLPKSYLYDIAEGNIDAEPDLFYFSAPGISGKFVFMEGGEVQIIPKQNTEIRLTDNGWAITANNGIRYTFTAQETTNSISEYSVGVNSSISNFISSWFLSQIEFPSDNRTITFEYINDSNDASEYTVYNNNFLAPGETSCCQVYADLNEEYLRTHTTTESLNLSKIYIKTDETYKTVKFIYEGSDRLSTIEVYQGDRFERRFNFRYGYFNDAFSGYRKRLRLDQIQEEGGDGETKPPYQFFYSETHSFPQHDSFSIDHWGYYNGKDNNTLIPAFYRDGQKIINGANRSPDFDYGKTGLLTKIIYPTGGYKEFKYEGHRYHWIGNTPVSDPVTSQETVNLAVPDNETDDWKASESFSLSTGQWVSFGFQLRTAGNPDAVASVELTGPNGIVFSRYLSRINDSESGSKKIFLIAGNYTLSVESGRVFLEDFAQASVRWYRQTGTITEKAAGGARIKRIKTFSDAQDNNPLIQVFTYEMEDGTSSGALVSEPDYMSVRTRTHESCVCFIWNFSSSSKTPLGTTMKSHIGYRRIEVTNGSGGKTVFNYRSPYEEINEDQGYTNYDWKRGLLTKKAVQDSENLIYRDINNYFFSPRGDANHNQTLALKVSSYFEVRSVRPGSGAIIIEDTLFHKRPYRVISGWAYLDSKSSRTYSGGSSYVESNSNYSYDSGYLQLSRKTQTNSHGQTRITDFKYAHEQYPAMESLNMLTQPYSVTITDGKGKVLRKEWILWDKFWHDDTHYWRPKSRWQWSGSNSNKK